MVSHSVQRKWYFAALRRADELLFFLFLFALVATRGWRSGLSHDEYQFVAAGQLLEKRLLLPYLDYPFLHMPYMAFLNALALRWTGYDLLAARGLTAFFGTLIAVSLYRTGLWSLDSLPITARRVFSGLFALLFVIHPLFIAADGKATNHSFPALASLLALLLLLPGSLHSHPFQTRPRLAVFLAGLMTGLALGTRLSYAALLPWFGAAVYFMPGIPTRSGRQMALGLFCGGVAAALIPAILLFLAAPQEFIYGNLVYIRLNTLYRELTQFEETMTLGGKFSYFFRTVLGEPSSALIFTAGAAGFSAALLRWSRLKEERSYLAVVALGAAGVMLVTSLAPTPLWPQYFFAPLPFLWIGLLFVLSIFQGRSEVWIGLVAGLMLFAAVLGGAVPRLGRDLNALRRPEAWIPVLFHQDAQRLRSLVPEGKVLTLIPILPLEAGLDTYEIFAAGPFSWRTAPILSPEKRREYGILAYPELDEFLKKQPPQAILVGFEANYAGFKRQDTGGLEKPLIQYAAGMGYQPLEFPTVSVDIEVDVWRP